MIRLLSHTRCTLALLALLAPVIHAADALIVNEGREPWPILVPTNASKQDLQAAQQLARYLGRMSGATFTVDKAGPQPPPRAILVGAHDPAAIQGLGAEDYIIRADGDRVLIAGGHSRSTTYGVYALLEQLGCRWWSFDDEEVPASPTLRVREQQARVIAPFAIHDLWNNEAQNKNNQFNLKLRSDSLEQFEAGHSLYPLLTPYATNHPDIYPMDKAGQRKANNLHFCYLAPGIVDALTEALDKRVAAKNGNVSNIIYFAGMGDWYGGMCECPACSQVYKEETWVNPDGRTNTGYSATLLRMINAVAEKLEARHPGVRVGTFAYMSLEAPPALTKPRANVVIRVPRLRHCTVHPADSCPKNRGFRRNLERWCEQAPGRVYVWEYGASFNNFLVPFPCLRSMADNLAFYHRIGIRGVEIQGNYVSTGGDLAVLKNHVWSRIFQAPAANVGQVLTRFCADYFGPAAAPMEAYVTALEESVRTPSNICADEFAEFQYLTPAVRSNMQSHADRALAAVAGQPLYARRVRESTVSLKAQTLWKKTMPLTEAEHGFVRKDLGRASYDEALAMTNDLRDASPSEWGRGKAYTLGFLAAQGGPIHTLTGGLVRVRVAPVMNSHIRQIFFMDKPLLWLAPEPAAKAAPPKKGDTSPVFPSGGGSRVNCHTRAMFVEPATAPNQVSMTGETGISAWDLAVDHVVRNTIAVGPDGVLTFTGVFTPAGRSDTNFSTSVTTTYAVGARERTARIDALTRTNDAGRAFILSGDQPEVRLADLDGVRITLPEQACQVEDWYAPSIRSATVRLNPTNGVLTVVVSPQAVQASFPASTSTPYLIRTFATRPLDAPVEKQ